ncbi:hypothetical protein AA0116_g4054 [Alternaria tenuissima]|nr:hypothetical protein AA0116_g4054 [Alternaria tenuissima]
MSQHVTSAAPEFMTSPLQFETGGLPDIAPGTQSSGVDDEYDSEFEGSEDNDVEGFENAGVGGEGGIWSNVASGSEAGEDIADDEDEAVAAAGYTMTTSQELYEE